MIFTDAVFISSGPLSEYFCSFVVLICKIEKCDEKSVVHANMFRLDASVRFGCVVYVYGVGVLFFFRNSFVTALYSRIPTRPVSQGRTSTEERTVR